MQPFKKYVSGHTTVRMCERLMCNIDVMKCIRRAYMEKDGIVYTQCSRGNV